jgi:hypothetical protein
MGNIQLSSWQSEKFPGWQLPSISPFLLMNSLEKSSSNHHNSFRHIENAPTIRFGPFFESMLQKYPNDIELVGDIALYIPMKYSHKWFLKAPLYPPVV